MNTSTKPILNLITLTTPNQFNLNTFGCSEQDQSFISFIHSFLTSNINSSFKGSHRSISLPTQDSSELYYLLDRLLSLIQSLSNQLQTSSLAQDELLSHLKISQSNLILAESSVYDLEQLTHRLQQPPQSQTSPTTNTINQSKRRDRVDGETDVGIYGRLNLFRFARRSTSTYIKPSSSSSPSLLSSPLNLSSSSSSSSSTSSLINCSSASSQSSFTSISSIHSSHVNQIEKLQLESLQLKQENQSLKSSLENLIESKRQIEGELESLSIELFQEANRIVRDERLKFVELENRLNELKNQLYKPNDEDEFDLSKRFKDDVDLKEVNHTDAFCTVTPKNVKSSMISTPERNPNEIKLDSDSPETMNFINPRLSKRFSQSIKPINNHSISNSICEVQQTYSPEPTDLDLNEWYKDLDKQKSNSHLDVEEEEEESGGMKRKQLGKERFKRSNSRRSYTSTSSKDIIDHHPINSEERVSSSSISLKRSSILTYSTTEEKKSRPNSSLSLKPLLLNTNTPIHSRLKIDSNPSLKRHSSLGYHFHPKISSPLSNQINKRSSSFNLISSSTSSTAINDLSTDDRNMIKDEIKSQRKNDTGNNQSKDNGLSDHHDLHLDLDSLLASIVDCAESLGFQDELEGIFH